jgi:phosphoribosyl-ATP pyrophosphohydrolase
VGDQPSLAAGAGVLDTVFATILERQRTMPDNSYVAHLLRGGTDLIVRKVGEEAIEVVLAAKGNDHKALVAEVADLWFHTLVLLAHAGLGVPDLYAELAARHGQAPTFKQKVDAKAAQVQQET